MKNSSSILLAIFISAFLLAGVGEYWTIASDVPATNPLDEMKGISETFSSMLPYIGYALALSAAWFVFCRKYYSSEIEGSTGKGKHTINQQILLAERELIAARTGTIADRMFFAGMISALFGLFCYTSLVFFDISPIRWFLI